MRLDPEQLAQLQEDEFQSTHSLRSATINLKVSHDKFLVSIHALLAECDDMSRAILGRLDVSIHALLAECDHEPLVPCFYVPVSIHALLAECDQIDCADVVLVPVSIHALLAECDESGFVAEA